MDVLILNAAILTSPLSLRSLCRQRRQHVSPGTTLPDEVGEGTNSPGTFTATRGNATLKRRFSWIFNVKRMNFPEGTVDRYRSERRSCLAFFYPQYSLHEASYQLQNGCDPFFFLSCQVRIIVRFVPLCDFYRGGLLRSRRLTDILFALCKIISIIGIAINFSRNYIQLKYDIFHFMFHYIVRILFYRLQRSKRQQ